MCYLPVRFWGGALWQPYLRVPRQPYARAVCTSLCFGTRSRQHTWIFRSPSRPQNDLCSRPLSGLQKHYFKRVHWRLEVSHTLSCQYQIYSESDCETINRSGGPPELCNVGNNGRNNGNNNRRNNGQGHRNGNNQQPHGAPRGRPPWPLQLAPVVEDGNLAAERLAQLARRLANNE